MRIVVISFLFLLLPSAVASQISVGLGPCFLGADSVGDSAESAVGGILEIQYDGSVMGRVFASVHGGENLGASIYGGDFGLIEGTMSYGITAGWSEFSKSDIQSSGFAGLFLDISIPLSESFYVSANTRGVFRFTLKTSYFMLASVGVKYIFRGEDN